LDVVMDYCDFSHKKYVRDCLEVLRMGAGLDNGNRLRRGRMGPSKYIYVEEGDNSTTPFFPTSDEPSGSRHAVTTTLPEPELKRRSGVEWEHPLSLEPPATYRPYYSLPSPCDPESPRVFHMFWTGPFTDKPYMAILSFLFTQNTGLHLPRDHVDLHVCRPQLWLWINPGPASSVPNPSVTHEMFDSLKSNPWSAPFLHPRFKDVVNFKLWNTTEQLDSIPEIKDEWRKLTSIFNSGGRRHNVPPPVAEGEAGQGPTTTRARSRDEELKSRTGSKSATTYDQLSVILSDIARFVLCHRYGGTYLDADTIFLRDWEELWGWKGAFAYRWSRLEKYNTAVLRLNKGSALGSWLFRTALKNDMDFHPFKLSVYAKQAMVEGLLLRLPDALFDPAWLNTEDYQLDRPAQPVFTTFLAFFDTPPPDNGAPSSTGFSGFFRGAFSYHFHNYWWEPFDPARNWPDLGPKFIAGETKARKEATTPAQTSKKDSKRPGSNENIGLDDTVEDDKQDLDWATVLKRTFESYIRGERPNMYGEWLQW
jgi:WD repeat and SOF domain-containing protein 1